MKINNTIKTNAMRKYRKSLAMTLALLLLASCFSVNGGTTLATAAASDFVLVPGPRGEEGHHIGDDPDVPHPGAFKGPSESYTFTPPNDAITTQSAQVILSTFGVTVGCNRFEINGVQIDGALRPGGLFSGGWSTASAQIPANALRPGSNTLFIQARSEDDCGPDGERDDFAVTNIFIHFRRP